MAVPSEPRRKIVHILVGGGALLLRFLTWPEALAFSLAGVVFNWTILPRLDRGLLREGERRRLATSGIVIYPLSIFALILCLPRRPDIVAIAWGVLAAGDGFATIVGAHVPSAALPWNRAKSAAGLAAFILAGGLMAIALAMWTRPAVPGVPMWFAIAAPAAAAIIAGFVETLPIGLDDNVSVPASAAFVAWSISLMSAGAIAAALPLWLDRAALAIGVNVVFALVAWRARGVNASGAIAGGVIGASMWLAAGAAGWALLVATFLAAALTTRAGRARKTTLGIAEARGGRRGAGNAIANTGLGAWLAVVACGMMHPDLVRVALVAALTTAGSDTVASEIGKAWGTRTHLITSWRRVPAGTPGAVSIEGTIAGAASAIGLAAIGAAAGLVPMAAVPVIGVAAILASMAEGVMGATLEARGLINNDVLNFVNTAMGAALAAGAWSLR